MRIRSAAVIVEGDHLLVIARRKDGRDYCVLPGGGVEESESLQDACLRELLEETGLRGSIAGSLNVPVHVDASVVYSVVRVDSRDVSLGDPERERMSESNWYEPRWLPVGSLEDIVLVPDSARRAVRAVLATSR